MVEWLFSIRDDSGELCRVYAETGEQALAIVTAQPETYGDLGGKILEAIRVEENGLPAQRLESK